MRAPRTYFENHRCISATISDFFSFTNTATYVPITHVDRDSVPKQLNSVFQISNITFCILTRYYECKHSPS